MARRASQKTDFGTVVLHWTLVALLVVSIGTGLRIATVSSTDAGWLHALDELLPSTAVWTVHMPAAVALFGLALAYAVYVRRAGLTRRTVPDRVRLLGLLRGGQPRWTAINIILTWVLLLTLLAELVTGCLMYLGYGGVVIELHRFGMWLLLAAAAGHVATHWAIGGVGQVTRILRPGRLPPPPPPFDPFDLIANRERGPRVPSERRPIAERRRREPPPEPARARQDVTLQAHPLVVAIGVALAGMAMVTVVDQAALRDELQIRRIKASEAPVLDGDLSDAAWRSARPVVVLTNQGANFDGHGTSTVEIRAVHDGETAYFSFVWSDPTRSLKHLPLIKREDGWHVVHGKYDRGDEHEYHEDKFAVLLTTNDALLAGDRTFHAGRAPIGGKPATFSGRGLHYTTDGSIVDVWQWRAVRGGMLGFIDDGYFGPPVEPTPDERAGRAAYKGGFAADPGTTNFSNNFEQRGPGGYAHPVWPLRLPKNWQQTWTAMGRVDVRSDVGESDGAQWWMTEGESLPYSPELDAQYPVSALIPGVIMAGEHAGDRADVRCAARWAAGRWALEIARRLDTRSRYDVRIASGVFLRVAAFDRSQIRHTRHIRPIRLEVE
jgi:Ethylbenzene dehydrogenase/Prokaryotic cytochrome b561